MTDSPTLRPLAAAPACGDLFEAHSAFPAHSIRSAFATCSAFPTDSPAARPTLEADSAASAVFGPASVLVPAAPVPTPRTGPAALETALFQGGVLLLAALYATLLYHALGDIRALFERVFRKIASSQPSLLEDPGSSNFVLFLNRTALLGTLLIGVLVLKFGRTLIPPRLTELIPHASIPLLGLSALLLWRALIFCQTSLLRLAGALTLTRPFVAHLVRLRRTYFALAVLLAAPAALLVAFSPPRAGNLWLALAAGGSVVAAVLYVRETLRLFLSLKISILHWFLYLCGVEMLPVSLLWLLATR